MQAERDFNNLANSSTTKSKFDAEASLSVSDARRRFEQLSSSPGAQTKDAAGPSSGSRGAVPPRPPPPYKKRNSEDNLISSAMNNTEGQSASGQGKNSSVVHEQAQDVSLKPKGKNSKFSLKKSHSVSASNELAVNSSPSEAASSDNKTSASSGPKRLFKRMSIEKGKVDKVEGQTATNGSAKGKAARNGDSSSPLSSPVKNSPLGGRKKKTTTPTSSSSQTPRKGSKTDPDFPSAERGSKIRKTSFSDRVLASTEERCVQTSLKDGSRGKVVGGTRPTSPKLIGDGELKLNLTEDMCFTGAELKAILNKQLAYISGGVTEGGHLILTFPDVGLKNLESSGNFEELMATAIYFKSLISIQQLKAGFTLIVDAHSSKTHNSTRQLLDRIVKKDFPLTVHMVCIIVKTNMFGRSKSLASPEVCAKLHLATFTDVKILADQVGAHNLTPDLGGTLNYDHKTWISNRLEFEKTQILHRQAMERVPEVTEALHACEVPDSIKDAEHLMQEDLKLKENLVNKIAEAELNIDRLVSVLSEQGSEEGVEVGVAEGEYVTMQGALRGMLQDMKGCQSQFDSFWTTHKARVDHMMRMCHFKQTAGKLECMIKGFVDDLMTGGVSLGDTLEAALELGEKHEVFVNKCKSSMEDQMEKMREDSDVLTNPRFLCSQGDGGGEEQEKMHQTTKTAIENVREVMKTLSSTHQQLITMCQQKRDLFIVCVKFHMTTRQVSQWNQDVLEFLASQPMESPSFKQANSLVNRIEDFLCRVQPFQIQALHELVEALPGEKQFQRIVSKTVQKYEHSCELLNNRKTALLKIINATASPLPGTKNRKKNKDKEKPDIELLNSIDPGSSLVSNAPSTANPEASLYLARTLASVSDSTDQQDGECDEATLKKRRYVYKELMATEEDYIKDLKTVIDSYYDAMDDSDSLSMPLRLRGKRDGVFGNLPEIYKFHDVVFKKALEQFQDHPESIGECFIQFTEEFQMYSVYCKNRSNSETLLNESTESEAFFKGIQRNLGHQLPLNSYLLKPVQRVTKYQLLLKDMMKHSLSAKKAHSELQQALDRMLKVLKNLNDSLHVVGLKGFPGALAEQGRLLVHDAFQMWENSGGASRSLFSRAKNRHVFLFEKVIIFSKKIEAPVQKKANKSDNYLYKGHMELADLVLREKVDGQPLQFSLTVHGQNKDFRFQASDKEIHMMWTNEIRRLLQVQFMLMKDKVIKSGTLNRSAYKGNTSIKDSRLFGDSFKMRPGEAHSKKSISDRFKLKRGKRKASASSESKTSKKSGHATSESSLLASTSFPANVRFNLKGGAPTSPTSSSLTQSSIETARDAEQNSMSSEDELQFSDEDDEGSHSVAVDHYESLAPGAPRYYMAISAYSPGDSDDNGIALSVEQEVEVIGINQYGWWWVRATNPSNGEVEEGWVPASYLKVCPQPKSCD